MILAFEIDGLVCSVPANYGTVGTPYTGAIATLQAVQAKGHTLVLWTGRLGSEYTVAVNYLTGQGLTLTPITISPSATGDFVACDLALSPTSAGVDTTIDWPGQLTDLLTRKGFL